MKNFGGEFTILTETGKFGKMRILILEDSEERIKKFKERLIGHVWYFTKDTKECIELLKEEMWDYIFLDHDMGNVFEKPGEGTGYEVAEWISQHPNHCPRRILIHTANNVGAAAMLAILGRAEIRATYIPFLWEKLQI